MAASARTTTWLRSSGSQRRSRSRRCHEDQGSVVTLAVGIGWFAVTAAARQQAPPPDFAARPASAVRYLKASNPGEDDRLGVGNPLIGVTMGMSADGNTLAVSAPYEGSGATGVNGNQQDESAWESGAVYVFVARGQLESAGVRQTLQHADLRQVRHSHSRSAATATRWPSARRSKTATRAASRRQSGGQLRRRLRRRLRLRAQRVDMVPAGVCEGLERRRRRPVRLVDRVEPATGARSRSARRRKAAPRPA